MSVNPVLSVDASKVRDDGNHLLWDSAEDDQGNLLTIKDQYLLFSDDAQAVASFHKVSVEGDSHTLLSLTDGVTYLVKLAQETDEAGILFSNTLSLVATSKPSAPTLGTIIGKDNSLQIPITHGSDGGSNMSKITFLLANGSDIFAIVKSLSYVASQPAPSTFTSTTADNANMVNNSTFEIACYTTNVRGDSPLSVAGLGTPSNYPDAPQNLAIFQPSNSYYNDEKQILTWEHPSDYNEYGSTHTVLQYEINYRVSGTDAWSTSQGDLASLSPERRKEISSLTNGTSYDFRIRYINDFGAGQYSSIISSTPFGKVSAVQNFQLVSAGDETLEFSWNEPSDVYIVLDITSGLVIVYY